MATVRVGPYPALHGRLGGEGPGVGGRAGRAPRGQQRARPDLGSYRGDTAALWAWDNGDLPIWMTFDAIEALRLANLAGQARPAWSMSLGRDQIDPGLHNV